MPSPNYEYDVALSFAGEDRPYVNNVATLLREKGVSVFYDSFEQSALWGKDLYEYLSNIYYRKARFCVIFISRHYAQKSWTNHERKSAQSRAFEENEEYILPARFDATAIPGIRPTLGYIDLSILTPDQFVGHILTKIGVRVPESSAARESWESYGWLFDVDGYRVAYIPLLNDWKATYKERSIKDITISVDSEPYKLPEKFLDTPLPTGFQNKPSCRLDFYSVRKESNLEIRLKETSYADYLRSGENLDRPFPDNSMRTFRDEFGRISRNRSGDLRLFNLTNICGVGLFVESSDGYLIATSHSVKSHVYPGRKTFSASGTMKWGAFPDPFNEIIRKAEKEINHLINPRKLHMVGFGADARKLYFQFSFLEKSDASLREIRKFAGESIDFLAIPVSIEQICEAILQNCWEPAAEATLLTLLAQRFNRNDVAEYLADHKSDWDLREIRDEWDYRAARPGLLPDMSVRYPSEQLNNGSRKYIDAVFRFMGKDIVAKSILEIGCGTGRITKRLVRLGANVTCIELSKRMNDLCRKRLKKSASAVRFINSYAQDCLPLPGHEVAISSLVLIHNVRDDAVTKLVDGICNSVEIVFLFEDITEARKTSPHTNLRSEETIVSLFKEKGFTPSKRREYFLFEDTILFMKLTKIAN